MRAILRVLGAARQLIPLTEEEIERARRDMLRIRPFVPVTIADRLSWEEVSRVAANAPALPGVTPEVGLTRYYPFGEDSPIPWAMSARFPRTRSGGAGKPRAV
jgi:penicillin-binding protein 2